MMRDDVIVTAVLSNNHHELFGSGADDRRKGAAGHDRCKKDNNNNSDDGRDDDGDKITITNTNTKRNGNIFTGILNFFAGLHSRNNTGGSGGSGGGRNRDAASDADRADALSTPLTAHASELGEDCCELQDSYPGPLLDPRWAIRPPIAGGQQKRKVSQPVAIKQTSGTRALRKAREETEAPEPAGDDAKDRHQHEEREKKKVEEEDGEEGAREETIDGLDEAERKIKAWQRRRMTKKRESFTVRGSIRFLFERSVVDHLLYRNEAPHTFLTISVVHKDGRAYNSRTK